MPKTPLGALREVVTIQHQVEQPDGQGGASIAWATFATAAANVSAQLWSGRENRQAGALSSRVNHLVEIVYRADITPAMRLVWTPYLGAAKTLEIAAVYQKDGQPDRLLLECSEIA